MKVRLRLCVTVVLCALFVLLSADVSFAQKNAKKPLQSVKKARAASTRKLPAKGTILPNQPPADVSAATQRILAERTLENIPVHQAPKAADFAPTPVKTLLPTPAQDTGTNLTGTQVLAQYFPTWRQELGGMFSNEQLDAVEKAFADTDEWMFVRGADGELKARNKNEWDYEARFLTILQNSGVSFTDKQIKQLVGGTGIKGFTFNIYFYRMKAVGFSCAKGTKPRTDIYRDKRKLSREEMTPEEIQESNIGAGLNRYRNHPLVKASLQETRKNKTPEEYVALARQYPTKPRMVIYRGKHKLSREEMTPEEVQEVMIGQGLATHRDHPAVVAYMKENRLRAEAKTPEEYVALARQYPTKPRAQISRDGHLLSREEMTPEEIQEVNIGRGLNGYRNHPLVKAYLQENRRIAESKTPEEYVALAKQYSTKPRAQISRDEHLLSREEMTPEEIQEVNIGMGLYTHREHPLVKAYLQENRLRVESQTTQQLYTALITHIKDYGHYPIYKESSLYKNIKNRLYYYKSTMTADGKYADPWLQKIYELKTLIQNTPDGKFTFTPDGQGGYTLEIEQPITEEPDLSAPQQVEEVAPAVPSRHALYKHITEDIKNMILQVRDQAALQRSEFYPWLKELQQHHLNQLVNKNTYDALWALHRAISFDYKNGQNRRIVTYLLQTVNNYVGILGKDEELGYFNKIIYRGNLKPGVLPQSDLFHVVSEQEGLSWNGDMVPQIEDVNRTYMQAVKRGETPGVFLDGDEERVTAIGLAPRVPLQTVKQDLENMLKQLLPPGFEVRMGLHELGISGSDMTKFRKGYLHIHLERPATTEEIQDGFLTDISISLNVKAGRFAGWWDPQVKQFYPYSDSQIAENYRTLFDSFLDEEAKEKLDILSF